MLKIGLTGGIASGKSTVSNMFGQLNIPVIDADKIAREVVEPGEPALKALVTTFGEGILLSNGALDRKKLGAIVFADDKKRNELNGIVHPAIRAKMLQILNNYEEKGEQVVVLDIPLLIESKLYEMVDKVLLVYVCEEVQLNRLINRDQFNEIEAKQRMNAQMPLKEKRAWADAIIDNNGTVSETKKQLMSILSEWDVDVSFD